MAEKKTKNEIPKTIGQILKEARKAQNLTLDDISKKLCISQRHLKNLEDDHQNLVCDVYTLGFLRAYSHLLNLDKNKLSQQFKEQTHKPSDLSEFPFPTPMPGKGIPTLPILGLSIFALVGLFVGLKWYKTPNFSVSSPKEQVLAEEKKAPLLLPAKVEISENKLSEPSQDIIPIAEETPPVKEVTEPQAPSSIVTLKVTEDAWIQVKDSKGDIILSRIFKPNESYEFKTSENLILKTGNARGIQLISGEKKLSFPKDIDPVQTNISLDPEKWVDHSPESH